jgi:hypothetical protein
MLWREQVNYQWNDDEVHFVLDQHADLDLYSASSQLIIHNAFYFKKWWQHYKFIVLGHELTYFVKHETKGKKCYT